jgi:alcohol dehydrogenase class IV
LEDIGSLAAEFGKRVLLVTGSHPERAEKVRDCLLADGCEVITSGVAGEPTIAEAERLGTVARRSNRELVIGYGGGSVIDAAKAAAALATNVEPALTYLEVIGKGRPLTHDPLPVIAIPTTAGTGAEVTRNAVLHSPEARVKVSLRSHRLIPRVALVDPETTLTLPPAITASTGMDALTQLLEAFLSCRANPLTDGICREALPRVVRSLERAFETGTDLAARCDMAFGSLCSGIALANAGLGAVHGLAAPLGGRFNAAHGAICAALLGPVLGTNHRIAAGSDRYQPVHWRFEELAAMVSGGASRDPEKLFAWVAGLAVKMKTTGLARLGVTEKDFPVIVEQSLSASSMKGNPVPLSPDVVAGVLRAAL